MSGAHTPTPWVSWDNKIVHVVPHKKDGERYERIATVLVPDGGQPQRAINAAFIVHAANTHADLVDRLGSAYSALHHNVHDGYFDACANPICTKNRADLARLAVPR